MLCITNITTDWTKICDVTDFMLFFLEEIVKINFNNYLLLNEIELVHIFFHVY